MKRHLLIILGLTACDGVFSNPRKITPDATPDATLVDGSLVFTTSKKYRGGQLGGVEGADAICAGHASEAGLPGQFKAWISQNDNAAGTRLSHSTKPYVLVNRIDVIADSYDDMLRFDLKHAIDHDEYGVALEPDGVFTHAVWTDTRIDAQPWPWTPGGTTTENPRLDCTLWNSLDGGVGLMGSWGSTDMTWTMTSSGASCTETARLYCFQQ